MSTILYSCPFSVGENCLGFKWIVSSAYVIVPTTEQATARPMPCFCLNISVFKSLFRSIGCVDEGKEKQIQKF